MNNLISVIVPIYNVEDYLRDCVDSIIKQTYENIEIILIDDGSTDCCGEICDECAAGDIRIKVIHKENGGVSSARNAGLDIATGSWIYFIDPDDWIEPNTLEVVLNKAIQTNTDMCLFDYEQVFRNKSFSCKALLSEKDVFANLNELETLCMYCYSHICWNYIIKAEFVLEKVRFDERIYMGEDLVFKFEVYGHINSFSYMQKILYHNRLRCNSATAMVKTAHMKNEHLKYNHMIDNIQKGNYPDFSCRIPNSILISELGNIVKLAFNNKIGLKCDYSIIQKYKNADEYNNALENYDERFIRSRAYKLYVRCTNKYQFIIVYLWVKMRETIKGKRRW